MVVHSCNLSYLGGWGMRLAWTQEAEVAVSWNSATAIWVAEQDSISKKKRKKNVHIDLGTVSMSSKPSYSWVENTSLSSFKSLRRAIFKHLYGDLLILFPH